MTGQETLEKVYKEAQNLVPNFYKIWREIGYDSHTINIFSNDFFKNTQSLWLEMLHEIEDRKYGLVKKVESLCKQIANLEKKLNMDVVLDEYENEPLMILEEKLQDRLHGLEQIKEQRLAVARKLLEKEQLLCESLGTKPVGMDNSLPSEEELQNFNSYLAEKEAQLCALNENFKKIRESIMRMMAEMSYTPVYDFEQLVCNEHQNFVFSPSNMKKLHELHDRMNSELKNMKETADQKRKELIKLWRYLDVPEEKYREFLEAHSDFSSATIAALNSEIADCNEIRNKNIARFVEKLREDLSTWWDICKFSKAQRDAFKPIHYETYTEDILTLHELELERVRKFYEDNSTLYNLLNKREEMWDQMKELERHVEDPDRFHNRGGQLLAEEKMRKHFNKNLPKLEIQLGKLIEEYEIKNGVPFTIFGLTLEEYVKQQVDQHQAEMQILKQTKAKAKDEKKSAKKTPLSASRRTPGMASSIRGIQTSLKRKQIGHSPLSALNKIPRMANSENSRPRTLGSKIRRSGRVARRILGSSFNKKSPKKSLNKTKILDSTVSVASSSKENPVYEEFKEYLGERDELRSTIVPEVNNSVTKPMKKPVKTPVKPTRKHFSPITPRLTPKILYNSDSSRSPRITSTPRFTTAPANVQNKF